MSIESRGPQRFQLTSIALCRFVDGEIALQLSVRLEISRFISRVFMDHIGAVVLEISQRKEDDISGNDPDLSTSQLATRLKNK